MAVALLCCTAPARAQAIGFEGGATLDPNQLFAGTHVETGEIAPHFKFRPGIDGSFGGSDNISLGLINLEFVYETPLHSGWSLEVGGGPAIVLMRQTSGTLHNTSTHAGFVSSFGFAHERGFFTEFKLGEGSYYPRLTFGAGFRIALK